MTIVRQDTFTRANVASGWGTATDGNAWTVQSGNGQSVASNEGQITSSSASTFATLGAALAGADAEGLVRFKATDNTHNTAGILLRWTDANNHWLARFNGAAGSINVMVKVAGTYTSQANIAVTVSISQFYWLRFRCQGSTISLKVWQDGTTEPSSWTAQYTNLTSQDVAGVVGLYGFASSGQYTYFDTFSVDDLSSGSTTTGSATLGGTTGGLVPTPAGSTAGTGIGDITRTTGTQTANKSGNGYGSGDLTGTEYDYAYTDATGSGWAVGANPWYGGMPISAWYQLDPTLNTTLPQKTSATGNLMTLLTTQSGGIVHWEEAVGGTFAASELPTFANAGGLSELAPANTAFRAYLKCVGDTTDANGIAWTAYACIYPGDPGFVVFRLDQHNPGASAISCNESDIELIASLLGDTGTNPTGIWQIGNGYLNTIGNATPTQWSSPGTAQIGTFDYAWVTPDTSQNTITLGTGAVVLQPPQTQFGWEASAKYEVNDSGPNATKPTRIKFGWYSPTITYSLPAGQTNTYYVLRVFSRTITQARMDAIAADFKFPGTPTTTAGTFTTYSVDERAYTFAAAAGNSLTATLDLSPAHVTARYKPIVKITNWTNSSAPNLTWGGTVLAAGTDYRYTYDAPNQTLYLQLYYDVVASGATSGQRVNAALAVTPSVTTTSASVGGTSGGLVPQSGQLAGLVSIGDTGGVGLAPGGTRSLAGAISVGGSSGGAGGLALAGVVLLAGSVFVGGVSGGMGSASGVVTSGVSLGGTSGGLLPVAALSGVGGTSGGLAPGGAVLFAASTLLGGTVGGLMPTTTGAYPPGITASLGRYATVRATVGSLAVIAASVTA